MIAAIYALSGSVVAGALLIALALAGYFSEDVGRKLRRECTSIVSEFSGGNIFNPADPEALIRVCVLRRGRASQ